MRHIELNWDSTADDTDVWRLCSRTENEYDETDLQDTEYWMWHHNATKSLYWMNDNGMVTLFIYEDHPMFALATLLNEIPRFIWNRFYRDKLVPFFSHIFRAKFRIHD